MDKLSLTKGLYRLLGSLFLLAFPYLISAQITFSEQTNLLTNSTYRSGVAIGITDMNGDGLDDIVHLNQGRELNIEYQQAPNATFSHFTFGNISTSREWSLCIADVDHNGYNDILTGGNDNNIKLLTANSSGSNYTQTNLPNSVLFLQGANFVDIDNDGWVDVFACHDNAESRDYRNQQDGTFVFDDGLINTTLSSGNSGNYASIWTDYDNDGDLDMYLSKCRQGVTDPLDNRRINLLFQNDGSNNFSEVGAAAGLRFGDQTWTTDFADIDNDGDMDCFIINHYTPSLLLENNGDGTFSDITASSGMANDLDLFGIQALFRDFDNDGYVDLLVTGTEHRLFFNNGDQSFTRQTNPFGSNEIESVAIGDLNNDGFLDFYAGYANLFNTPSSIDDEIYINNGNSNNYFGVRLQGISSNINGIGARLELHGSWGMQIREMRSGEGYGIMNSLTSHFGIANATTIDKLVVRWPSGTVDELLNPSINTVINLVEGSTNIPPLQAEFDVVNNVNSNWQTINLDNTYQSMVVVATVVLPNQTALPAVARVRNASGNSFELRVQNPSESSLSNYTVHYVVVEEGVYSLAQDGIKMEAVKRPANLTSEDGNWLVESQSYQNSYSNPVVLGQVMSSNDPDWSVFWSSSASNYPDPPTSSSFAAGKHVGEDNDNTRASETIGYLVFESGSGQLAGKNFTAGVGPETVQGVDNSSTGHNYAISGPVDAEVAVLSAAGMQGNNGAWPVLFGASPISSSQLTLASDEDQLADSERSHIAESAAYLVIQGEPSPLLDQTITFDPLANKLTSDGPFDISASASSGLSVNFSIISGPASISGNTITLDGTEGTVVVEAIQAGDAQYNPAPAISRSFEVSNPPTGGCPSIENLAVNKPSSQSGTQQGATASRANDGNTDGNFWLGQSVSLTTWASESWWEVDLEQLSTIETINIWNRNDSNTDFLTNYYILVSDLPFLSTDLNATLNQAGVSSYLQNTVAGTPTAIDINRTGRYVRVQLQGTAFLGMAEVEVMGCLASGGGPYDQSITFDPLVNKLTTDAPFDLTANASSGLAVSYSIISGPASISGNTLTLDGTEGTVIVAANQAGNTDYNPAPEVRQAFDISLPNPNGCNTPENLALNKPSTQVGTQQGANASRANDGDTDGNFWVGQSVSLTTWTSGAWWEVDLQVLGDIQTINIWNRDDANIDFLNNYYVLVSDLPFNSTDLSTTLAQPGVDNYLQSSVAGRPTMVNINRTGRYIRIQLQGTAFLGLAEVEVMGCPASGGGPYNQSITFDALDERLTTDGPFDVAATASSSLPVSFSILSGPATISGNTITLDGTAGTVVVEATQAGDSTYLAAPPITQSFEVTEPNLNGCTTLENLALDKPATQSGTQQNAGPERANDGNTNGNFWAGFSVSLTTWAPESWWEVDLEADSYIEEINIWNRTDVNQGFLANYYVLVSDTPFSSTDLSTTLSQAGVDAYLQTAVAGAPTSVRIRRTGRYVRVQLQGTAFLGLAEVEVMGCQPPPGPPPAAADRQILYLDAQPIRQSTYLNWVSQDNTPGSYFVIERSVDGQRFEEIAEVSAIGNTQQHAVNYELMDEDPQMGDNYYRIIQRYSNQPERNSLVEKVRFGEALSNFGLFPNPAQDAVYLNLKKYTGANGVIQVFNSLGQPVLQQELVNIIAAPYRINLEEWKNGVYWVMVKVEGQKLISRQLIVKRLY